MNLIKSTIFDHQQLLTEAILNEGANVNSLSSMFEKEWAVQNGKRLGFELSEPFSYKDLEPNHKKELADYIAFRKKEMSALVNEISLDKNDQNFIYRILEDGQQQLPEDFQDLYGTITQFNKIKKSTKFVDNRDINQYNTFRRLHLAVYNFNRTNRDRKYSGVDFGTKLIDGELKVWKLTDQDYNKFALFIVSNNIAWCVKDRIYWDQYGAPYYYFEKDNKPYALLNFISHQFMDVHDSAINDTESETLLGTLSELLVIENLNFAALPRKYWIPILQYQNPDMSTNEAYVTVWERGNFGFNSSLSPEGLIDIDGDICIGDDLVDRFGVLRIQFGTVKGKFKCSNIGLCSLEGCPKHVGGSFDCSGNQELLDLIGGPETVGGKYDCSNCSLRMLEGAPKEVPAFNCSENRLTDLFGAPQKVRDFDCGHNLLKSLEGGPQTVTGNYICGHNQLKSLKGAPDRAGLAFLCDNNKSLTSLDGAPNSTGGDFDCRSCSLKTLEGGPDVVGGNYDCTDNDLESLEGFPTTVGMWGRIKYGNGKLLRSEIEDASERCKIGFS